MTGSDPPTASDRIAVLARWARTSKAGPSLSALVQQLQAADYHVVVVSAGEDVDPIEWPTAIDHDQLTTIRKPNVGYDFGSWSIGLAMTPAATSAAYTLLLNDSLVGPFAPIEPLVASFERSRADVWGVTESTEIAPHLQSYWMGFRNGVLTHPAIERFWSELRHWTSKVDVVSKCEVGLSRLVDQHGLEVEAMYPAETVARDGSNPVLHGWRRLLYHGFPFVKRSLVSDLTAAQFSALSEVVQRRFAVDLSSFMVDEASGSES